jgi:DNA-directed RNA polymerase beta subunit/intein/homing endonuclease
MEKSDILNNAKFNETKENIWMIIESYFKDKHLENLVRHQLESYNNFVNYQIIKTIEMFNPVYIVSENDFDEKTKLYSLEVFITFKNFHIYRPQIHENNGAVKLMFPQETRLRNFTYSSNMTVDLHIQYVVRSGENLSHVQQFNKVIPKIQIGKIPIMLKSNICILSQYKHVDNVHTGECKFDAGGYFIINGSEKIVLGQERAAENRIYCFNVAKHPKYSWMAEIKSVPDFKCISPKQINMYIATKNNGFGHPIVVQISRVKQVVPLCIVFRALGVITDKEICEMIILNSVKDDKTQHILQCIQASIVDANQCLTKEDSIRYIMSSVMYTPMNMDREMGAKKKYNVTLDILSNDLFPHCNTLEQKKYFLGYMAHKLIKTSIGILPPDDRDSYLNKRVDLTGSLLNNLFRNYFNKLVKDAEKQIIREINTGSWRSTEDYTNIITMSNINKIIKSNTIENGLKKALSTGDFSIKHSNTSKVGVAQVLTRLTYISALSHSRRISTPIDKSGKLIPPRKLHNTSWGFLCCLTADTDVLLGNRMDSKKINNIHKYDEVNTIGRDDLADQSSRIYNQFHIYPKSLFKITTSSGRTVKATGDHPFLVNMGNGNYQMKRVDELVNTDRVIIRHMVTPLPDTLSFHLWVSPTEGIPDVYTKELIDMELFNTNLSYDVTISLARLIGLFHACGKFYYEEDTGNSYIYLSLFNDKDVEQLAYDIHYLGFCLEYEYYSDTGVYDIYISGSLAYYLYLVGTEPDGKLSRWILQTDHRIKAEFLSAYKSNCKTIQNKNNILTPTIFRITSETELSYTTEYYSDIAQLFKDLDIYCSVQHDCIEHDGYMVKIVFDLFSVNIIHYHNVLSHTYNDKKRIECSVLLEYLRMLVFLGLEDVDYETFERENALENGLVSITIDSIQSIPIEPVYDFTTESDNHSFVASSFVVSNCSETPEGQSVGVVKNLSYMTHVTIHSNSTPIYDYIVPYVKDLSKITDATLIYQSVKVFVNGCWLGITENPMELYHMLKMRKYNGTINIYTSIVFDFLNKEIKVCNDSGRLTRPLLKVNNNNILVNENILNKIEENEFSWDDLLNATKTPESIIEYIDPEEQSMSLIAMNVSYLIDNTLLRLNKYTHCEIHPSTMFGVAVSCIPFPDHNQSPRNTYQAAQSKQAIGVYVSNPQERMDKTAYVLSYAERPLVETRVMNMLKIVELPAGNNVTVAIMTHTGYNQEDSLLINKGSIDRGMFLATVFHTEKDEDKQKINGDEEIRCKPDPTKTKGMKMANYGKLNSDGVVPENTFIENRDIIIAKVTPIKENRNDPSKHIKFEDQSRMYRSMEETYVDKNYIDKNGDGYNMAKVRLRTTRKPVIGDKFCALPTQQVLTHLGWVCIKDIDITLHKCATMDKDNNIMYEFPSEKFVYENTEPMYFVNDNNVHIICTMNHRLYVNVNGLSEEDSLDSDEWFDCFGNGMDTEDCPKFQLLPASEIIGKPTQFQLSIKNNYQSFSHYSLSDRLINITNLIILTAIYYHVGYDDDVKDCYVIQLDKNENYTYPIVSSVLFELKIKFNYYETRKYITIKKGDNIFIDKSFNAINNKIFPEFVWTLSRSQARYLLKLLSCQRDIFSQMTVITYHEKWTYDIARLAIHCSYNSRIILDHLPCHTYNIEIITEDLQPIINVDGKMDGTYVYTGDVYCIEMPTSHTYISRETSYSPSVIIGNSSRSGQKGTVGAIIQEADMPYTDSGIRPDIIINPHAIPSRMTMAQLKETLLCKVLVMLGLFGDGTSYGDMDVSTISDKLLKLGFEKSGDELLYNGTSGTQIECRVFVGPVFYQRLKHMVSDKYHSRSTGRMVNFTRQPAEGRSRDGGLRFGEMERDAIISHGASRFIRSRMYDVSDKYQVYVCKKCGMIASYNDKLHIHICHTCGNRIDFSFVQIPYACKLMFQELMTMNIVPRMITED